MPVEGTRSCPACCCRLRRALYTSGSYHYVECLGCGLAHLDPLPGEDAARANFDDGYFTGAVPGGYDDYVADEALHRQNARLRLRMLGDLGVHPPGKLLDIGCAHGFFLDEARSHGWTVRGVEVSPAAAKVASTRFGLDVVPDLADAVRAPADTYDVVTLFQVLEHVASPLDLLRQVHDSMTGDGAVVIETWDRGSRIARLMGSRWQEVAPPSVVWLWDRESIALLLASAGFELTNVRRTAKRVSLRFVTSLLEDQGGALGRVGHALGGDLLRDRSFLYRFGDLVTVIGVPGQPAS